MMKQNLYAIAYRTRGVRTFIEDVSNGIYDPLRVEQVFEAINSINLLSLRDNWAESLSKMTLSLETATRF